MLSMAQTGSKRIARKIAQKIARKIAREISRQSATHQQELLFAFIEHWHFQYDSVLLIGGDWKGIEGDRRRSGSDREAKWNDAGRCEEVCSDDERRYR